MTNPLFRMFEKNVQRKALRKELEALNDRELSDIGITRADFQRIISNSF